MRLNKTVIFLVSFAAIVLAVLGTILGVMTIDQSTGLPEAVHNATIRLGVGEIVVSVFFGLFILMVAGIALAVFDLWHDRFNPLPEDAADEQ